MQDLLSDLRSTIVNETIVYDGDVLFIDSVQESETIPGLVCIHAFDGDEERTIRTDKTTARSLRRVQHVRTMGDLADHMLGDTTYDLAVPRPFAEEIGTAAHFVWVYEKDHTFGRPQPLTQDAYAKLAVYDDEHGTDYEQAAIFPPKTIRGSSGGLYVTNTGEGR